MRQKQRASIKTIGLSSLLLMVEVGIIKVFVYIYIYIYTYSIVIFLIQFKLTTHLNEPVDAGGDKGRASST